MFDTTMIGKKIKQARINKNMTQMNLADAMGVSYQAVSNWERGNSMPDISKLGDLCAVLELTVNELLGLEESTTNALTKAMENEKLTMEELAEVAPMLPPKKLQACFEETRAKAQPLQGDVQNDSRENGHGGIPSQEASDGIHGMDAEKKGVKVIVRKADKKNRKLDLSRIADMAPFLGQEYLDKLVRDADWSDLNGLEDVAPFLGKDTLDYLVERTEIDDIERIAEIAPFLGKDTVEKLVARCMEVKEFSTLEELAPFVSRETLDRLAENVQPDSIWEVVSIAPFFSQKALDVLVRRCEASEEFNALEELAPFVSKEVMSGLIDRYIEKGSSADISGIYPFLEKKALQKLAQYVMEKKDLDALGELMPFV